jgi:hypothetical protein
VSFWEFHKTPSYDLLCLTFLLKTFVPVFFFQYFITFSLCKESVIIKSAEDTKLLQCDANLVQEGILEIT